MSKEVKVRIAPSPTGYLHIGTARTALFNFLFAKSQGGKFLLRVEDTDEARNNEASYNSILNGLKFLGLQWEGEVVYQKNNLQKHQKAAQKLVESGVAYNCFVTEEELARRRAKAQEKGERYIHKYTKGDEAPREGIKPVVRLKTPLNTQVTVQDEVQGEVTFNTSAIDDFVLLRSDGTPVYMLSVVCDDIEMGITHVIRGSDHLTNTPKQILLYNALLAPLPVFAHIPLIHGEDGKKLSKCYGALSVEEYKAMGYLPQALRSYLVRLGWGSENTEVLTDAEMVRQFSLKGVSRSPSCFDFEKLKHINHHFINALSVEEVVKEVLEFGAFTNKERLKKAVEKLRYRYFTLTQMAQEFKCFDEGFKPALALQSKELLAKLVGFFEGSSMQEEEFKEFLKREEIKPKDAFPLLRTCLVSEGLAFGIFEIAFVLGKEEFIKRLKACL